MTASTVTASFLLNDGTVADMSSSITDNTDGQQLLTSTKYSVSAVTIGTFAEGKALVKSSNLRRLYRELFSILTLADVVTFK